MPESALVQGAEKQNLKFFNFFPDKSKACVKGHANDNFLLAERLF